MKSISLTLQKTFRLRFFKNHFVRNIHTDCSEKKGHALLYYKVDSVLVPQLVEEYSHTNDWEILEIIRILNHMGYWVDVMDRSIQLEEIKLQDKYDIFIGLGAGNSGKYFHEIGGRLKKAFKIMLAAGPNPELNNQRIKKRYEYFRERHPAAEIKYQRVADKVNISENMKMADAVFCVGDQLTLDSYISYGKPLHLIKPSTSPYLKYDPTICNQDMKRNFLYFGGSGHIVKGLDIALDVFSELPDLDLHICGPKEEVDFIDYYQKELYRTKNIHFYGFIAVGGKTYLELVNKCGFVLLPSCSEGIATSVVTCMRNGLIPIVTPEAGVNVGDFGFILEDLSINKLKMFFTKLVDLEIEDFRCRRNKAFQESGNYTRENFTREFEKVLCSALKKI